MMSRSSSYRCLQKQMRREALAGNACPVQSAAAAVRRVVMMLAAKEARATNRWGKGPKGTLTHRQREIETEMRLYPNLQFFDSLAHQ